MRAHDLSTAVRECVSCRRCYDPHIQFCPDCLVELVNVELIPHVIDGRYRLERVLGRGGMGVTFAAADLDSQREVAVKVIRAGAIADPRAQDRLQRELQLAARLDHPQLAAVYDYGTLSDASAYVAMELVRGGSLRGEMKRVGRFSPHQAAAILSAVAGALDAAHKAGLVHRDLNPESIGLAPDVGDDAPQVKLFGFAFGRVASGPRRGEKSASLAQAKGQPLGAPAYLSPEQFRGEEPDLRSDLYSLGIIAYEMLAGRPPFGGKSPTELSRQHLAEKPRPLQPLNPEVNALLEAAVLRALEKDPQRRQQRASEFKRELMSAARLD